MKFTKNIKQKHTFQALPGKFVLKGARIVDPELNLDENSDIYIEDGVIKSIEKIDTSGFDGEVLELDGKIVSPGWMDMHIHLREPGREDEETILSGSLAAANGGFSAVCCMPNTKPAIDTQEIILYIKDRARGSLVNVHPIAAITKRREGKELSEVLDLVEQGAVAISDDNTPVMSAEIMRRALEYSRMVDIPVIGYEEEQNMSGNGYMNEGYTSTCLGLSGIPAVSEEVMIARDILLAEYCGGRFHVAHISTRKSVDLVRQAKARGVSVTAEVTPHHLKLTEDAVRSFNTNTKVKPPLRTEDDRQALLEGLKDNTIDVIASDHAPHSWEEKAAEYIYAPFGVIGLETTLGVCVTELLQKNTLDLNALIRKFTTNPYRILGLKVPVIEKGQTANLTIFSLNESWVYHKENSLSKSSNSPFLEEELVGKPFAVINNNQFFKSIL